MKQRFIYRLFTFIILGSLCAVWNTNVSADNSIFEKINLPQVRPFELGNGTRVFYVKDDLPVITIYASIGFGQLYETRQNAGISSLIAKTISLGGSKKYPGMELHKKVDSMGGAFSVSSSYEGTSISIRVLKRFKKEAFEILSDILMNPNFEEQYFVRARALLADEIRRRYDEPFWIARDKIMELVFDGNCYGAIPSEKKMKSYSLNDVKSVWTRYRKSKNIMMGISTSLEYETVVSETSRYFSMIPKGERIDYGFSSDEAKMKVEGKRNKIYLYPKDIPQSVIVVGTVAPDIRYDGKYALSIMNYILGGGMFNSRLMREIRVKRGMAYSAGSSLVSRLKTGVFLAYAQTKSENVATVLTLMNENIAKMSKQEISGAELSWAQNSINNSYIFDFDTPIKMLSNYINLEYYNLPKDYYSKYLQNVNSVKKGDVVRESSGLFRKGLVTCVVGKKELKDTLKQFGEVIVLEK